MKKLLIRAFLLGFPFAVLLAVFQFKYAGANNNQYIVKKRLLAAAASEVEVLVLGSSYGYYDILPEYLGGKAFNLAATSQSIYYDTELTLKYLDKLPALKSVVVPISDFTLEVQLDDGIESWRCYFYSYFYSLPQRNRHMAGDVRNFSLYFLYGRDYPFDYNEMIDQDVAREFTKWGGLAGDDSAPASDQKLRDTAAGALVRHTRAMNPANLPINFALLEKMDTALQKRKVRLILVTTPVTPYYRSGIQPAAYAQTQAAIAAFCRQHGASYGDYLADDRFTLEDFLDGDHLNHRGAVKFSQFLAREVLRPGSAANTNDQAQINERRQPVIN